MKFDLESAKIFTPKNVELGILSINQPGEAFFNHNNKLCYSTDWILELDGTFKDSEVPYIRSMAFKITDSFTTFFVLCYAVKKDDYNTRCDKYKYLVCHDVDNLEFLERAERTDKYSMIFDHDFKGKLPPLEVGV